MGVHVHCGRTVRHQRGQESLVHVVVRVGLPDVHDLLPSRTGLGARRVEHPGTQMGGSQVQDVGGEQAHALRGRIDCWPPRAVHVDHTSCQVMDANGWIFYPLF